jgi:predicted nucleic acid-binding protein
MSTGFLVDTNVVSELTKSRVEPKVQNWVATQALGVLSISVVSIGEMEKGFTTMRDLQRRVRLESWLERQLIELFRGKVLPVTQSIAKRWGAFDGLRQMSGRPLGVPDGLIAATAFEHGLTLVTRNVKDFELLGVTIFNPWTSA